MKWVIVFLVVVVIGVLVYFETRQKGVAKMMANVRRAKKQKAEAREVKLKVA